MRARLLALGLLLAGMVEMVSVASVLPFIQLVVQPNSINSASTVKRIYEMTGAPPPSRFVVWLGLAVIALTAASAGLNWIVLWAQSRFAASCQIRLTRHLFERCVRAPYSWFLTQNTTALMRLLYEDVQQWSAGLIQRLLAMIGNLLTVVLALSLLIAFSRVTALAAIAAAGLLGYAAFAVTRPVLVRVTRLKRNAKERTVVAVTHALNGIKDVKLSSQEPYFIEMFSGTYGTVSLADARLAVWQASPAMVMVLLGQVALVGIALLLRSSGAETGQIASQLALLVIVTAKVLPAASSLSTAFGNLWNAFPYVDGVQHLLRSIEAETERVGAARSAGKPAIKFWQAVNFCGVGYRYPNASEWALQDVSLQFQRGLTYAVVGRSAAGKSTLIDLLVGLLDPSAGSITVDGQPRSEFSLESWQRRIGYVPQAPFIADDSLLANVAFGLTRQQVDRDRVLDCLRMANLAFLPDELEQGLETRLGDRGQRLSGGQRQRIAIARALYKQPEILVFDEATSALDSISEREILDALDSIRSRLTLIVIAHRLATVAHCDRLFLLDSGRLIDEGIFAELQARHPLFQEVALGPVAAS